MAALERDPVDAAQDAEELARLLSERAERITAEVAMASAAPPAQPGAGGLNAGQMLTGGLRAALLLHCEPGVDSVAADLSGCEMVVTLSPFKANMDVSDVLLPIAPFTETSGSFVNAAVTIARFSLTAPSSAGSSSTRIVPSTTSSPQNSRHASTSSACGSGTRAFAS